MEEAQSETGASRDNCRPKNGFNCSRLFVDREERPPQLFTALINPIDGTGEIISESTSEIILNKVLSYSVLK